MWRRLFTLLLGLFAAGANAAVPQPYKAALIIANSDYRQANAFEPLANPLRDANLVGSELEHVGFRVSILPNAGRAVMIDAVTEFVAAAKGRTGAVLLVYYAGHAVGVEDRNYLLSPEVSSDDRSTIEKEGVSTAWITAALRTSGATTALFFIDACQSQARSRGWMPAVRRRAAEKPDGDVHVIFSTMPNDPADDGPAGGHSPFSRAFAQEIAVPDQPLPTFLHTLNTRLEAATGSRQRLYTSGAVSNEPLFCFAGCGSVPPPADELRQSNIAALNRFEAELDWNGVATALLRRAPSFDVAFDAYSSCGPRPSPQYCQFTRHGKLAGAYQLFNEEGEIDPKELPLPSFAANGYPADLVLMLREKAPSNLRSSKPLDESDIRRLASLCQDAYTILTRRQCEKLVTDRVHDIARYSEFSFVPKRLPAPGTAVLVDPLTTRGGDRRPDVHWHGIEDRSRRDGCGVEVLNDRRIVLGCFVADRLQGIVRVIEPGHGWWMARYEDGRPTSRPVEPGPLLPEGTGA